MRQIYTTILVFIPSIILVFPAIVGAQTPTPADQHDQHHPQTVEATPSASVASTPTPDKKMTDSNSAPMTSGMGEMMNRMGNPPQKELYPSLMELPPDLPSEKRAEIQRLAQERINKGNFLLKQAGEKMSNLATAQNPAAMQEALAQMRQGLALLESGLAAQRALAENQNSREAAVKWFKREMNLSPGAAEVEQPHGFFGLSWFHYVSMLTLAAFSGAMIWIYFQRMKRAGALAARLAGGSGNEIPLPAASTPASLPLTSVAAPVAVNLDIAPSKSNSWSGVLLVSKIFDEAPQVKTFRLTDPSGGKLPFNYLPGQFVTITVAPGGVPVKRSYTISSSPTRRDYCEITVKCETSGTVSHYLHERVHEGELLQLTGPSGKFTFTGEETDGIVLIAGGVGVTPLMSVIRYLTDRSWKGAIFFFFGCKTESDIIYREEIEYLEKRHPNLRVWIILEEPPEDSQNSYFAGRITKEILEGRVPEIASRRVHICGPPPMIEAVKEMLDELRVPKENVHTEIFVGKLPAPKAAALAPEDAGKTAIATFARSRKTVVLTPDKTILEASEEAGVSIDYSCRVGTCGICKTKLLSGKVTMDVEEALTDEDRANNIILACQAKATEDVAVDA
jgi:glycine betaine catabolism B